MPTIKDALDTFYPAALAAYGSQNPDHLLVGNNFVFTSQIVVDPIKAAQVPPQHLPILASMLKLSPVFGFVAKRPGAVFVSIRGTETPGEWLCDFEAVPTTSELDGGGTVHEGFQKVYEVIRENAFAGLTQAMQPGDQLFVTGHSLGAALATLFAYDAAAQIPNVQVCTFAGPRTGLGNFVASFNQRVPNSLRIVNRWDIVPNVPVPAPPLCLYKHVDSLVPIDGGFTLDLGHAHSLQLSYMPGLKKAAGQPLAAAAAGDGD